MKKEARISGCDGAYPWVPRTGTALVSGPDIADPTANPGFMSTQNAARGDPPNSSIAFLSRTAAMPFAGSAASSSRSFRTAVIVA